jgi:hypothetical protein
MQIEIMVADLLFIDSISKKYRAISLFQYSPTYFLNLIKKKHSILYKNHTFQHFYI